MFVNQCRHPKPSLLFSITVLLFFSFHELQAQSVNGIVKDAYGKPLQFANVLLIKSADSSLIKGIITDATGKYLFENIKTGKYIITATFTGMTQVYTNPFEITADRKEADIEIISLKNADVKLKNVSVAVKKPLFEQKIDRMVINVKNSITDAGGTALDVVAIIDSTIQ